MRRMTLRSVALSIFAIPGAFIAVIGAANMLGIGGWTFKVVSAALIIVSFASVLTVIVRGSEKGDELSRAVFGDAAFSAIGYTLFSAVAMLIAYLVFPFLSMIGALVFVMGVLLFSFGIISWRKMGDEDDCLDD